MVNNIKSDKDTHTLPPLSARKQTIARHFSNANDYHRHANVQAQICELLVSKIHMLHQSSVLEVGAGQGQLTEKLSQQIHADNWHINELCSIHKDKLQTIIPTAEIHIKDGEYIAFSQSFSLIISANAIQWFDNPLTFVTQSAQILQTNGQLLFSTFTPNNFKQIKKLTGQGLNYPSKQQWHQELRKYFDIVEISTHLYELTFESPLAVLKHIKQTGVSVNTSNNFRWSKSSLMRFIEEYQELYSDKNGKVILGYEALLVDARKK